MKKYNVEIKQIKSIQFIIKARTKNEVYKKIDKFFDSTNLNNIYFDSQKNEKIEIIVCNMNGKRRG